MANVMAGGKDPDPSFLVTALNKIYDTALDGLPGTESVEEFAQQYLRENSSPYEAANSLIRWQIGKSASSGFLTGLGGLVTLPVTIPANMTSVYYLQLRMIAAIAVMGGLDARDDRVKTLIFCCLTGQTVGEFLKDFGVQLSTKLAASFIKEIPGKIFIEINKAVGFRLITKAGSTGLVNVTKAIPFLGGIVGGSIEGYATNKIGDIARDSFIK